MKFEMFGRKKGRIAHIPFYKDEKVIGRTMTVSFSVRLFLAAVIVFALATGWVLFKVINDDSKLHAYVEQAHANRVADQKLTHAEIDQLACYIVANIRNSEAPIVSKVRAQYDCPAYGKDPNFKLYKPFRKHHSKSGPGRPRNGSQSSSKRNSGRASGGNTTRGRGSSHGPARTQPGPGPVSGPPRPHPTPAPTPTPSPGPSPHPTPSPSPSPSGIVSLPVTIPPLVTTGPIGVGGTCTVQVNNVCVAGS